jgi:hypothetical protein
MSSWKSSIRWNRFTRLELRFSLPFPGVCTYLLQEYLTSK